MAINQTTATSQLPKEERKMAVVSFGISSLLNTNGRALLASLFFSLSMVGHNIKGSNA